MRLFGRGKTYRHEVFYEQWTGCPSCGYQPDGPTLEHVDLVRLGITNDIGRRAGQYAQDDKYYKHVGIIALRHHPEGTSRASAREFEDDQIWKRRPPFNIQGNPDFPDQQSERDRILGQPVALISRAREVKLKAVRVGKYALAGLGAAGLGFVAALVLLATRF